MTEVLAIKHELGQRRHLLMEVVFKCIHFLLSRQIREARSLELIGNALRHLDKEAIRRHQLAVEVAWVWDRQVMCIRNRVVNEAALESRARKNEAVELLLENSRILSFLDETVSTANNKRMPQRKSLITERRQIVE